MKANSLIKTLFSFLVLAFFSITISAQTPEVVQKAFTDKFPKAKSVKWPEPEAENEYDVEFKWNKKMMAAQFDGEGNWLETETEIPSHKLPAAVRLTISVWYPDYELDTDAVLLSTTERETAYEVFLDKDDETLKVTFTAGGRELEKEVETED